MNFGFYYRPDANRIAFFVPPDTCDWSWQETRPVGVWRTYLGVNVFEGAYPYAGMLVTPSWGGSMFEALMPDLFVPEERWAPHSWGVNHPLTVEAQIYHGLREAGYGYWGFSPSNVPEGGYNAYGVDAIGMNPDGYPSNEGNTLVDHGFAGCGRDPKPDPLPSAYTNGVVTPHAWRCATTAPPRSRTWTRCAHGSRRSTASGASATASMCRPARSPAPTC